MSEFQDGRALQRLLDELGRLPGIGPKSAQRIAYHLLEADSEDARRLADAILEVKQQVHFCPVCFNYATRERCDVCDDPSRDTRSICVVSEPRDVSAIERTGSYHGLYHVLGGIISPMEGVGPADLEIQSLVDRVGQGGVAEVILALSSTMEGDATGFYIYRRLQDSGVRVTVIARGVAQNDELQYTDEVTLGRALQGRIPFSTQ
jgi:recombination protein RecR